MRAAFWDTILRGTYITILGVSRAVIPLVALYAFLSRGRLDRLLVNVAVPMSLAILWFGRELVDQIDARRKKIDLQQALGRASSTTMAGRFNLDQVRERATNLQVPLFGYCQSDVSVRRRLYRASRRTPHERFAILMQRRENQNRQNI